MIKRPRHKILSNPKNREGRDSGSRQSSSFSSGDLSNHHRPSGSIHQSFDRYTALAKEAQVSGDRVAFESFLQHADHYLRLINASRRPAEPEQKPEQKIVEAPQKQQNTRRRRPPIEGSATPHHEESREAAPPPPAL